jgi:hypothetical protein
MKHKKILPLLAITAALFTSCKTVAVTGRKQLNLVPNGILTTLSFAAYDSVVKTDSMLPQTDERAQMVTRVGNRIQQLLKHI